MHLGSLKGRARSGLVRGMMHLPTASFWKPLAPLGIGHQAIAEVLVLCFETDGSLKLPPFTSKSARRATTSEIEGRKSTSHENQSRDISTLRSDLTAR